MKTGAAPQGDTVILVGHGGVPSDYPREKVRRLRALEAQRHSSGQTMGEEELALDHELRHFPRTAQSDPYQAGVERLAAALAPKLAPRTLRVAYNEFCAPSIPEAIANAVAAGAQRITLLTTMLTPGGSHAEQEIPELIDELRTRYPEVAIRYAWPVDLEAFAAFLQAHLERTWE